MECLIHANIYLIVFKGVVGKIEWHLEEYKWQKLEHNNQKYVLNRVHIVFSLPGNEPFISPYGEGPFYWATMLHLHVSTVAQNKQNASIENTFWPIRILGRREIIVGYLVILH